MTKIKSLEVKEILDSKGDPAIEVELRTDFTKVLASVPSGISQGKYEALELRDKDGKGVSRAIEKLKKTIEPALKNKEIANQKTIDELLLKIDGTKNKSYLGANTILAVSIAVCRTIALVKKIPLYQYLNEIYRNLAPISSDKASFSVNLPKPSFNMIEGGRHGQPGIDFQEFMIMPQKNVYKQNLEIGIKIYQSLRDILEKKFGERNIVLSKESAFCLRVFPYQNAGIKKISEAFNLILEAAEKGGFKNDIKFAIDVAASEFYQDGNYKFEGKYISKEELIEVYQNLVRQYPIVSIEDPFSEEDFDGFAELKNKLGNAIIIFGDDLTASNIERVKLAKKENACNGLILKPNQIGTVTETLQAAKLAKSFGWKIMVANRAGETEDDFIADLAVGIEAEFIKSGAPFAKERMAKYNRLLKIERRAKL